MAAICHFRDDIFKCILVNENVRIAMKISLKFVPMSPIEDIPALVQIMPWHWPANHCLNHDGLFADAYMHHSASMSYSLSPGRCGCHFKCLILIQNSVIDIMTISSGIVLWWMLQDHTDDKSTLLQVMAWCHQAMSHYLSQCWRGSTSP